MPELIVIVIRSLISFIVLLLLTRLMGKRQVSQLTFFDYIVGITIGSIAAEMSFDQNVRIIKRNHFLTYLGTYTIHLSYNQFKIENISATY